MRTSIVGKIMMALIFVSLIGGISAGPALGRNGDSVQRPQQRGWADDRDRHDDRDRRWDRGRREYRPHGYYRPGPSYGPPIYAVPAPSPGIRIFLPFPFDIR